MDLLFGYDPALHEQMTLQNSIAWWYPLLLRSGVKSPRTIILDAGFDLAWVFLNSPGGLPEKDPEGFQAVKRFAERVKIIGDQIGYPLFLRSSHGSGKHQWRETCYVEDRDSVLRHIFAITEWGCCVDLIGLPARTWAVRELLPTSPGFYAFDGLPICRERRYFIQAGRVVKHIPYWPREAMRFYGSPEGTGPDGWESILEHLNEETRGEVAELTALSEKVAKEFADYGPWSLDWMLTSRGWYAIDMARAERSWGWNDEKKERDDNAAEKVYVERKAGTEEAGAEAEGSPGNPGPSGILLPAVDPGD